MDSQGAGYRSCDGSRLLLWTPSGPGLANSDTPSPGARQALALWGLWGLEMQAAPSGSSHLFADEDSGAIRGPQPVPGPFWRGNARDASAGVRFVSREHHRVPAVCRPEAQGSCVGWFACLNVDPGSTP